MKMTSGAISVPKAASGPLPSSEKKSFDANFFYRLKYIHNRDTIQSIITSYNVDGGTCERVVSYILFFPEFPEWQCEDRIIMNRKAVHSTRAHQHYHTR